MKLIKVPTIAVVLFLITTGAIILKGPKSEPDKTEFIDTKVLDAPASTGKSMPPRSRFHTALKQ